MRSFAAIVAELNTRDLLHTAHNIARGCKSTVEEMFSESRARTATIPRHAFWAELKDDHAFSYQRIADLFGCERTTILHGVKTHRIRVGRAEDIGTDREDRIIALEARIEALELAEADKTNRIDTLERLSLKMRAAIETLSTSDGVKFDLQVAS